MPKETTVQVLFRINAKEMEALDRYIRGRFATSNRWFKDVVKRELSGGKPPIRALPTPERPTDPDPHIALLHAEIDAAVERYLRRGAERPGKRGRKATDSTDDDEGLPFLQ